MAIKTDTTYQGQIVHGSTVVESSTGTLGFKVMLICSDGETSHTIWLTEKTKENAEKTFREVLGIELAKLQDANYVNQIGSFIEGKKVEFLTGTDEYKGKSRVAVKFINKPRAVSGASPLNTFAEFFGGRPNQITDEDIPF